MDTNNTEFEDGGFLDEYSYTKEEIEVLNNLLVFEILEILEDEAAKRPKGDEFTLPELLESAWDHLNPDKARQAAKEFKIKVCQRYTRTVYFLPNKKRNNCYIYRRR